MNQALACGKLALLSINLCIVLSWSMQIMEMCFRKYAVIKRGKPILRKKKYGTSSYKSLGGSKLFMIERFFTEI